MGTKKGQKGDVPSFSVPKNRSNFAALSEMEGAAFFVRERKFTFGSGLSDRYKQRLAGCKAGISATNK